MRSAQTASSGRSRDAGGPEHFVHNFSGFVEGSAGTLGEVASPGGEPRGGGGGGSSSASWGRGRTGEFRSQYWCVGEQRAAAGPATGEAPEDGGLLGRHGGDPASGGSAAGESGDRGGLRSNRCRGGVSNLRRQNCARRV